MTERGPAARDQQWRLQIRRSSSSAPSNLAEGFGRYRSREFARFCRVARGSLAETANHIRDGVQKRYFESADADALLTLAARASRATTGLIRYLESCADRTPGSSPQSRGKPT